MRRTGSGICLCSEIDMCRSSHQLRQLPFQRQAERCTGNTAYEEPGPGRSAWFPRVGLPNSSSGGAGIRLAQVLNLADVVCRVYELKADALAMAADRLPSYTMALTGNAPGR